MANELKTLSPEAASLRYGIPKGSLANMRCRGVGPKYYKRGRRVVYLIEDFEKWLLEQPVLTLDSIKDQ